MDCQATTSRRLCMITKGFVGWHGQWLGPLRWPGIPPPNRHRSRIFQAATTYSATETDPGIIVFVHDLDAVNRLLMVTPDGVSAHPADAVLASDERAAAVFNGGGGALWILATDRTWLLWKDGVIERFPPPHKWCAIRNPPPCHCLLGAPCCRAEPGLKSMKTA